MQHLTEESLVSIRLYSLKTSGTAATTHRGTLDLHSRGRHGAQLPVFPPAGEPLPPLSPSITFLYRSQRPADPGAPYRALCHVPTQRGTQSPARNHSPGSIPPGGPDGRAPEARMAVMI